MYHVAEGFPERESYGLRRQMCRAAVSIASNIAEGKRRKTRKDFVQFLHIADGSAAELETQILIAESAYPHMDFARASGLLDEVQKMLGGMLKKLEHPAV
jgi:four helix bundle protein